MKAVHALGVLLLSYSMGARVLAATEVTGISLQQRGDEVLARIAMASGASCRVFSLEMPDRVVVDIPDAAFSADYPGPQGLPTTLIQAVRHGYQADGRLRLVFDLERPVVVSGRTLDDATEDGCLELAFTAEAPEVSPVAEAAAESPVMDVAEADEAPAAETGEAQPAGETVKTQGTAETVTTQPAGASLIFGSPGEAVAEAPVEAESVSGAQRWNGALQRGLVEGGYLYDDAYRPGSNMHVQFIGNLSGELTERLELRLGARFDGHFQSGDAPDYDLSEFDYDETWLRYRSGDWRLTLGGQRIIWGRTDEISPTDRLSTRDFTRFILDDLRNRRRANPAVRLEWFRDEWSVDLVYLPLFREAELPGKESIWYPVDGERGAIAGLKLDPSMAPGLEGAVLENDVSGEGGAGVRVKRFGESRDFAFTVQRVRNPEPYFALKAAGPGGPVLETVYPRTWVVGGDLGMAVNNWTFRFEGAWLSDQAYTTADFEQRTTGALNWVAGGEVFPGDRDLRLTVQIAGTHLLDVDDPIDRENILALTGELEGPFGGNRWRGQLRWWAGLNRNELYLNPEIVFTGLEPSELYLGLHLFQGDRGTPGDFYGRNDMIVVGWRGRF